MAAEGTSDTDTAEEMLAEYGSDGDHHHLLARRSRAGEMTSSPAQVETSPESPATVPTLQDRAGKLAPLTAAELVHGREGVQGSHRVVLDNYAPKFDTEGPTESSPFLVETLRGS